MRHNKKINHLGRQASHRKALMSNMAASLILHKRIETTVAKAKALKKFVEPIITKSKEDTTHQRRVVFSYLKDKFATTELFRVVAPKIADRPGGYTRILHTGFRVGDAAEMCIIELVDFNETYVEGVAPKATAPKTRRSRAKKAEEAVEVVAEGETVVAEEAPKAAKKPAAKKPAAPKAPKATAAKTSGAKVAAVKTGASKKAYRERLLRYTAISGLLICDKQTAESAFLYALHSSRVMLFWGVGVIPVQKRHSDACGLAPFSWHKNPSTLSIFCSSLEAFVEPPSQKCRYGTSFAMSKLRRGFSCAPKIRSLICVFQKSLHSERFLLFFFGTDLLEF